MVIRFVLMLLCGALVASCASMGTDQRKEKAYLHLQIGTDLLAKGENPQALRELLAAEKLDPSNATIQNNLGLAYFVREKYDAAEKSFKKALSFSPQYTDARNNLGLLYIEVGLYDKAIEELNVAAADLTYSQPEKSWANLGRALFLAKQYEKAKIALQNSLKERRDNCFTMNYYGRTLFELKSYTSAVESLDQAVKLCEKQNFDEPYFYGALGLLKLGETEKARGRLNEVVQLYPNGRYAKKAKELLEIAQ